MLTLSPTEQRLTPDMRRGAKSPLEGMVGAGERKGRTVTVQDLIDSLSTQPRDAIVFALGSDECIAEVTGLLLEPSDMLHGIPCAVTICVGD